MGFFSPQPRKAWERYKPFMKNTTKIQLLFIYTSLVSCNDLKLSPNSKIISKFVVLNEIISPKTKACTEDNPKPFANMEGWECSFKLGENVFDIERKFYLDKNGNMIKLDNQPTQDNINYSKHNIDVDKTDYKKIRGTDILIKLSESRTYVIDNLDTLKISKIFEKEKLIFVEGKMPKGKRFIYQYK